MNEILQDFVAWFVKFAIIASVALLGVHLLATWYRKKKTKDEPPSSDKESTPGG